MSILSHIFVFTPIAESGASVRSTTAEAPVSQPTDSRVAHLYTRLSCLFAQTAASFCSYATPRHDASHPKHIFVAKHLEFCCCRFIIVINFNFITLDANMLYFFTAYLLSLVEVSIRTYRGSTYSGLIVEASSQSFTRSDVSS